MIPRGTPGNPSSAPGPPTPIQRITLLILCPAAALVVGDLLQGGGWLGTTILGVLLATGALALLPWLRWRGGGTLWIGALAVTLAAGGLLLWGDLRAQSLQDEWSETVRPRLLRRASQAEVQFDEVLDRLARPAEILAEQPFAGAYSTELDASPALFDLVQRLRSEAGLMSPRYGVDLLDSLGRSVAWSGRTSILPGSVLSPIHNRSSLYRVLDTRAGTRLIYLSQVGDSGNLLVVEYLVRSRFDRNLPSDFLPSLPRSTNPSPIRFQDHLASQAELDAVFRRRESRYWGADDRVLIFPLHGTEEEILAVVALRSRPPEQMARDTRQRTASLATALISFAILGLFARIPGPANPLVRLLIRSAGLWLVRLLLARGGFPAGLLDLRAFDFETFASPALGGLMRSPADFLLTGITMLLQAILVMEFVRRLMDRRSGRGTPALALPDGGLRTAALLGGLALLAGMGLHGFDRLARHIVNSSNLDLLRLRLEELSIDLLLLHGGLLTMVLAGGVALAAVGWGAARLTRWGFEVRPGPLGLPERTPVRNAVLPILVGASLVVYPLLVAAYQDAVDGFYEEDLMPRVQEHHDLHRIALLNTIEVLTEDVELAEQLASPRHSDFDELAFDRWSRSSLARQGLNSSIELLDVAGRVLGEFSLNMPRVRRDVRRNPGNAAIEREILQTGDQLEEALHGSRAIVHQGKTIGFLVVRVLDTAHNLPFLSSTDPYTQFFRRPGRRPPEETAYGVPVLYDYNDDGTPSRGGTAPAMPPLAATATEGEWHRVRSPSGEALDLLFSPGPDGVYALGHRAAAPLGQVGGFVRMLVLYLLLAALGGVLWVVWIALQRPGSLRPSRLAESLGRSYYRKLFVTFVVASLIPLLTLAVFLQEFIGREIRQELVVKGGQSLDSAARILTRITADPVVPTVDDGVMDLIRNMVGADLHLYVEDRLLATSRRELLTAGLLPAKLAGSAFRDLYLENRLLSESRFVDNGRDVTLLASSVNLGDLRAKAVLALHVHSQPGVLEAQVANVEDAILIATTLLMLLLAGTGYVGARLISAPILRMVTATRRLARGELDTRVHVRTKDETASLASSFNEMSRALKTRDEELRSHLLYIQKILENATTGVISLDETGSIVTINTAAHQLLNRFGPIEIGTPLLEFLESAPALEELARASRSAWAHPDEELSAEVALRDAPEREARRLRAVFVPFELEPERPGQILLVEDITDVARSNRLSAWAEMARGIAHEVKNPLTPIQLAVGHLRRVYRKRGPNDSLDDPKFRATLEECLDIILEQVEHLRQISKDFSSYARIPESRREPTDPGDLIRSVLRPYAGSAPASIRFEEDLEADLPETSLDPDLIRRTLVNLVENSLQAMPDGGRIRVSAGCTTTNGNAILEISVSDTGVGVEPEALKRLFEPYFSTKASGTGLGLAIARKAVEEHGGEISAESHPGAGTTFKIRIPVRAEPG